MRCSVAASETLDSQQNIAQPGDRGPLYGVSCSLVATSTVTRSKQQLLLLCRDHGCVRLRAAACGCVRLRATTSGARTGACWCSQGVGRRELIFRVICSVCAHTSSCGAHLRHAPTHRRGICSHSSAPQRRRQRPKTNATPPWPQSEREVRGAKFKTAKPQYLLRMHLQPTTYQACQS